MTILFFQHSRKVNTIITDYDIYNYLIHNHIKPLHSKQRCQNLHTLQNEIALGNYAGIITLLRRDVHPQTSTDQLEKYITWVSMYAKLHPPLMFELGLMRALLYFQNNIKKNSNDQLTKTDIQELLGQCVSVFSQADILTRIHYECSNNRKIAEYKSDLFTTYLVRLKRLLEPNSGTMTSFTQAINLASVYNQQLQLLRSLPADYNPCLRWLTESKIYTPYLNNTLTRPNLSVKEVITFNQEKLEKIVKSTPQKTHHPVF